MRPQTGGGGNPSPSSARRRNRLRTDPVGTKKLGETVLRERLASGKFSPWFFRIIDSALQ
jgi:hypothetical protein